jgi:type IV pilus assembly protein PilW
MKSLRTKVSRQAGFSLLELMVATLLGMILAAGVVSVYVTSMKDYALNNALEEAQKSGRLALSLLEPKIRMAGFFGCGHGVQPENLLKTDQAAYNARVPVQGYEYTGTGMGATYPIKHGAIRTGVSAADWSPSLPPEISEAISTDTAVPGAVVPGSDILLLHEAVPGGIKLVNPYTDGADGLFVAAGQGAQLGIGELAVVSDCNHADLFQITDIVGNHQDGDHDRIDHSSDATSIPGNATAGRSGYNDYAADSQILHYETYLFYIGVDRDKGPSLYEISTGNDAELGRPVEVASGVENMQMLYGVDTDGDKIPNQYLTADQITDWSHVISVRIALLTRSSGNSTNAGGKSAFKLLDPSNGLILMVSGDGHIRKVFEETVSIRNRLP